MSNNFIQNVEAATKELNVINSNELNDIIQNNDKDSYIIIDVNDKEDVESRGMIENAVNISLGTLFYKADDSVPEAFKDARVQDRNKKVIMTCGLGLCAAVGGKLLKDYGFKDVNLLQGGVTKWIEDGYTVQGKKEKKKIFSFFFLFFIYLFIFKSNDPFFFIILKMN